MRRVVERAPDGRLRQADVVGDLVGLDAQTAVVEARSGLVEIPVALVTAARPAVPSTADELALEAVAAKGIRSAETAEVGGWLLRADHGFLRRANSVLPLRPPGVTVAEALATAHDWYAERGLPVKIGVPSEARRLLDAELGERGWGIEVESHVMVARVDRLVADPTAPADPRARSADEPDDAWSGVYHDGEGLTGTGRALLVRHPQVTFVSLVEDGHTLAIARGVVDDGWLGISCVEVAPAARRRGAATAVMDAAWRWGSALGATRSYLQVEADNDAAVSLYARLGYWVHHDYRYRVEPAPGEARDLSEYPGLPR